MKVGKLLKLREKLLNRGYLKARRDFHKVLKQLTEEHNQAILELEKSQQTDLNRLSELHQKNLREMESNYKKELKNIKKRSDSLNARLSKKIERLDEALEIRDQEIARLRQITEQALLEQARRTVISDRVLKEASLLRKTDNELKALKDEALYVAKKSDKKLRLA